MQNYRLLIEYDGRNFEGWQRQKRTENTIQQRIERAIEVFTRQSKVNVTGAGRTDSGVSAKGQVANFKSPYEYDLPEFIHSVNAILPKEITILSMEKTDDDFHARYSAVAREYFYNCSLRRRSIDSDFYYHIRHKIEFTGVTEFMKFAKSLKCFRSFCRNKSDKHNFECNISDFELSHDHSDQAIQFRIRADRFLHSMIRALAGCALDIGRGRFCLDEVITASKAGDKLNIFYLPPKPLILNKIFY